MTKTGDTFRPDHAATGGTDQPPVLVASVVR